MIDAPAIRVAYGIIIAMPVAANSLFLSSSTSIPLFLSLFSHISHGPAIERLVAATQAAGWSVAHAGTNALSAENILSSATWTWCSVLFISVGRSLACDIR